MLRSNEKGLDFQIVRSYEAGRLSTELTEEVQPTEKKLETEVMYST
jgi:hypothetical protein